MNNCYHCKIKLDNDNWYLSSQKKYDYICINCHKEKTNQYYIVHRQDLINKNSEYQQTDKGKLVHRKACNNYRNNNLEKERIRIKNFEKTEQGKLMRKKIKAKHRKLGFIQMFPNPFAELEQIEWHHITDILVVAIPKDLHQLYGGNGEYHREKTMEIVKQIYFESEYNDNYGTRRNICTCY